VEETSTGYRDLTDVGFPGGESAGMTSLAAATAAIISARWSVQGDDRPVAGPTAVNGHIRHDVHFADPGYPAGPNGHAPNGHATNGHPTNGHVNGHANGFAGNGYAQNGYEVNGHGPAAENGFHDNAPFAPHPYPPDGDALPPRVRGSASVAPSGPRSLFEPAPAPLAAPIFETPTSAPPAPPVFEPPAPGSLFEPRSAPPFPASAPEPYPPAPEPFPTAADAYPHAYAAPPDQHAGERYQGEPFPSEPYQAQPYPTQAYAAETYPMVAEAAAAPTTVEPTPARGLPDQDFSGSVMAGLRFPAPFEPEPFEAYDPFEPKPRTGPVDPLDTDTEPMLPQRVPAEPDVPNLVLPPNDPLRDPATATMSEPRQLSRIAQALREDDGTMAGRRPDGFDLDAVLDAVRAVPDVSDAHLRWNPESGHTLRIEFKDDVDEGKVTRRVVQLLRESMGLPADLNGFDEGMDRTGGGVEHTGGGRVRASAAVAAPAAAPPAAARAAVPGQRPAAPPLPPARRSDGSLADLPRVVLDHVQMATLGHDATLEVRLAVSRDGVRAEVTSVGVARGPAVDAYLLRLAAQAAGDAVDRLLIDPSTGQPKGRTFVEHATVVSFGGCDVAVVVLLLTGGPNPEQLSGSTVVVGDPVQAVVRATLSALNRRLESLLS
jgi:hypothetical protein